MVRWKIWFISCTYNCFCYAWGIRRDVLEVAAGTRERLLSDLEYQAKIKVEQYNETSKQARNLWKTISQTHPGALAKSHTLYKDYHELKTDRDSWAAVFQENPRLYYPFLKGKTVAKQAAAHYQSQLQQSQYDRMSPEQRGGYDTVKAYIDARNEACALFKNCKTLNMSLESFHQRQTERDGLALKIVTTPERFEPFFKTFNVNEEKLLTHAVSGEIREMVKTFNTDKTTHQQELTDLVKAANHNHLLKQSGLNFNDLRADENTALYEKQCLEENICDFVRYPNRIREGYDTALRYTAIQIRIYHQEFAGQVLTKEQKQDLWDRSYYETSDNKYKRDNYATEGTNQGLSESAANLYADLRIRIEEKSGQQDTGTSLEITKLQTSRLQTLEKKYEEEGYYQCILEGMKLYDQITKAGQLPDQEKTVELRKECDHELCNQTLRLDHTKSRDAGFSR